MIFLAAVSLLVTAAAPPDAQHAPIWRARPFGLQLPGFVPPTSLAPLVKVVSPSVVNISAQTDTAPSQGAGQSLGSGFILGPEGYVVTNNHVVDQAKQIRVRLEDGREFMANVVGKDASTDVALLKLAGDKVRDLPFAYLGDSDRLEVGDWVVAIGNPFGFDHSVSHGMISAKERVLGVGVFDDFIQTDALMNPGNSGGPLFDMRGQVVGVNTAIVSHAQGIGFAVPINMVRDLLPNLLVNGRLARGWVGLKVAEDEPQAKKGGAVVQDVYTGGPAMQAGLHDGDRIVAVNGKPVDSYLQLLRKVAFVAPGATMKMSVVRNGATRDVTMKVMERPAQETALAGYGNIEHIGLIVQDVDSESAVRLNVAPYHGVLVTGVVPGGVASQSGLREGDLITHIDGRPVEDIHALHESLDRNPAHRTLKVSRGGQTRTVALTP